MTDALAERPAAAFGRRTAALLAVSSVHLPRVLDVTVLGDRRELVLAGADGPTLSTLLARRRRLSSGEAVTVVVSAVRAVAALHEAGYCGVALTEHELCFDDAGTPMLLGLDEVRETLLAGAEGPADDWRAVAALADRLGLVAHGRAAGALGPAHVGLGLALATLTAGESGQSIDRLEAALFELAEPEPVRLDGVPSAEHQTAVSPLAERKRAAAHRRPSSSVLIEALDAGPAALLAGPLGRARSRMRELAARLRGRARLLVIAGVSAAALTVAAVVLLPQKPHPAVVEAPSASTAAPGAANPSASPSTGAGGALLGDDPVAAASVLLAQRDGCLTLHAAAKAGCLDEVADGRTSDLALPARPLAGLTPSLIERSGDSVLIALTPKDAQTPPASALMMRTEAGWRLRQLYED